MSVLVQPWIDGQVSGVLFTADPQTGKRDLATVSFIDGDCTALVSGTRQPGYATLQAGLSVPGAPNSLNAVAAELIGIGRRLEELTGMPMDCEFTIRGGRLYMLQARPISSLTRWKSLPCVAEIRGGADLPGVAKTYPKVSLRALCSERGVDISRAWIITGTPWHKDCTYTIPPGNFSCVLIYPRMINNRVWRIFTTDPLGGAAEVLAKATEYWVRHAIVSHILRSNITGIASIDHTGKLIVEVARGHFVPKGIVETTVYTVDGQSISVVSNPTQTFYYDIDPSTGEATKHRCQIAVNLDAPTLHAVSETVRLLTLSPGDVLEFGIDLGGKPFVIDIQSHEPQSRASRANTQVIEPGRGQGALISLPDVPETAGHFFEARQIRDHLRRGQSPVIVWAKYPTLAHISALMKLADDGYNIAGAIFEVYSPLCHLSLLLREWQIPTVVMPNFSSSGLAVGSTILLVAEDDSALVKAV